MGIFPFNRNKYARELNCRERYHARELMSFHFIFVANFIRDKNPLYGSNKIQTTHHSGGFSLNIQRAAWLAFV